MIPADRASDAGAEGAEQPWHVGVDLGGTNLRCALFDEANRMLARSQIPTAAWEGSSAVIGRIAESVTALILRAREEGKTVGAVGIGVPGPVDRKTGVVSSTPNMPGWENIPLSRIVSERVGARTIVENDANCAAWGEFVAGAGRGCRHMVMVTLGTGVGGAIILDGTLHTGRDGAAGELGHMCIVDEGRPCGCGAKGCVEAYASATAVVARFRAAVASGWKSPLIEKGEALTCRDIFIAAESGDPVASRVVERTGHYLGVMASSIAEMLNPDRCIVAGGMIQAGEKLFAQMRETCLSRNTHPARTMEILPASLGPDAGLVGAAACAMRRATPAP
jgi:glucokinase